MTPPVPVGDPGASDGGWKPMEVPAYSPLGEINFFWENVSQLQRATRHWDQRLEIATGSGGTLRTSRKPKDQGVQGRKRATVKQEPGVPSLGVGGLTRNLPPRGGANLLSPRTAGAPERMSTGPTSTGQGSCWHCPLQAQRTTRVVWLGL